MKRFVAILLWLVSTSLCLASGWNDYERNIGDGYSIIRANSFDLGITYNRSALIDPYSFKEIGPVYGYHVTDDFIFARAYGRKMRSLFEGDTFEEIDLNKQYYFVLRKGVNTIKGPMSVSEFENDPVVLQHSPIQWQHPRNPNFWRPLLGNLMFLTIAIPILAFKYFWISIPLIIAFALIVRRIRRKWQKVRNG